MSPGIYISKDVPGLEVCYQDKQATVDICEYLIKHLPGVVSENGFGTFEAMYFLGSCDFQFFTAEEFSAVYQLSMQACDELDSLKPYKAQLKAALEADPRFKQAA